MWFYSLWFKGSTKKVGHRMWETSASSHATVTQERRYDLVLFTGPSYALLIKSNNVENNLMKWDIVQCMLSNYNIICLPSRDMSSIYSNSSRHQFTASTELDIISPWGLLLLSRYKKSYFPIHLFEDNSSYNADILQ